MDFFAVMSAFQALEKRMAWKKIIRVKAKLRVCSIDAILE